MEPDDLAVHDLSELRAALVAVDYTTERLRSLLSIGNPSRRSSRTPAGTRTSSPIGSLARPR